MINKKLTTATVAFALIVALFEGVDAEAFKTTRLRHAFHTVRAYRQDCGETVCIVPAQGTYGFVWRRFQWDPMSLESVEPCAPVTGVPFNAKVEASVKIEDNANSAEEPSKVEDDEKPAVEPVQFDAAESVEESIKVENDAEYLEEPIQFDDDAESVEESIEVEDFGESVEELTNVKEDNVAESINKDEELRKKIIGVWIREESIIGLTSKATTIYHEDGTCESFVESPMINLKMKKTSEYEISNGFITFKADEFSDLYDVQAKIEFPSDDEMKLTAIISQEMSESLMNAQRAVADARESGALDEIDLPFNLKNLDDVMEKIVSAPQIWRRVK